MVLHSPLTVTERSEHSFDLPELVMFGLEPPDMQIWLNDCVRLLREHGDVPDGVPFNGVLDGFPVLLRTLDSSWKAPLRLHWNHMPSMPTRSSISCPPQAAALACLTVSPRRNLPLSGPS